MKQLEIQFKRPEPVKAKRYFWLPINQKINVKANSGGFAKNWLTASLLSFRYHSGIVHRSDHPGHLTEKWFWHHKTNDKKSHQLIQTTLF